jgi:hypothetical protein
MLLGAVTVISFISALASLLHILRKEALKVKEPTTEFTDPITPVGLAAKPHAQRPRGLLGPLMTAAAALMVFVLIVVEAQTGVMRSPGGYVGLLLLLFFLIVSAVFQLGSSIAARLGQLFKAEEAKGTEPFASP